MQFKHATTFAKQLKFSGWSTQERVATAEAPTSITGDPRKILADLRAQKESLRKDIAEILSLFRKLAKQKSLRAPSWEIDQTNARLRGYDENVQALLPQTYADDSPTVDDGASAAAAEEPQPFQRKGSNRLTMKKAWNLLTTGWRKYARAEAPQVSLENVCIVEHSNACFSPATSSVLAAGEMESCRQRPLL